MEICTWRLCKFRHTDSKSVNENFVFQANAEDTRPKISPNLYKFENLGFSPAFIRANQQHGNPDSWSQQCRLINSYLFMCSGRNERAFRMALREMMIETETERSSCDSSSRTNWSRNFHFSWDILHLMVFWNYKT